MRTTWRAKPCGWRDRERVVALGEEHGPAGPLTLDVLEELAKEQRDDGQVRAGLRSLARGAFLPRGSAGVETAREILQFAARVGALDDLTIADDIEMTVTCRVSGFAADQGKGYEAVRKAQQRDVTDPDEPGHSPETGDNDAACPESGDGVPICPPTGQDRTGQENSNSTVELDRARARLKSEQVTEVFTAWVQATERDPARTKLTPDRRRRIEKALASHGLADCLAAVRRIGADAWARGANDRDRRFDDIEHALGSSERIERWRDQTPRPASPVSAADQHQATRQRRGSALAKLVGGDAA